MLKKIALYYLEVSPPSRAVLFTAKSIGIELDLIPVDIRTKEHLTPEFIKVNLIVNIRHQDMYLKFVIIPFNS